MQQQEICPTNADIKWPLLYFMNALLFNHSLRMKNKDDALLYVDQAYYNVNL